MTLFVYFLALFAFVFLSFLLILVICKRKKNYLQYLLIGFIVTIEFWFCLLFFEDVSLRVNHLEFAKILERFKYLSISITPIWIILLSYYFARDGKTANKFAYLLAIDPVITQFALWTNDRFNLFYSSYTVLGQSIGSLSIAHIMIFNATIAFSVFFLFEFRKKSEKEMHTQATFIILSTSLPILVNILYIAKIPYFNAYATPISFAVCAFSFYRTILKYNFLENTPLVLRSIVDRISYVYIVLDEQLTIVDFNEPAFQAFPSHRLKKGTSFNEIINAYHSFFDYDMMLNVISEARKTRKPVKTEIIYHPTENSDTDHIFQCEFTPIFHKDRYRACIMMGQDITQSKKDYASFVEQERLTSIAQMIGSVVQNLKAPVLRMSNSTNNIDGITEECLQQLKNGSLNSDEFQEIIREIRQNLQSQRSGIEAFESILSTITEQTERLIVENGKSFSLEELSKRVEFLVKDKLKATQCTLKTTVNGNKDALIQGDMGSLAQILLALITNSIHAYKGAEGFIYFTITQKKENVLLSIGDYAGGIPMEIQDKLFKQVVTTKGKHSSGTNLYMAHATIIGHFQGKMWFTSKQNEGAEFFIELPLLKADTEDKDTEIATTDA